MLLTAFHGLCMSVADSVPGVSGGTIAFIMGFYEKFITSLHNLVSKDKQKRKAAILYMLKLGIGWAVGMVLCLLILSKLFESQVYVLCSAFLGLTLASIPFVILAEKDTLKGHYAGFVFTLLGLAFVAGLSYLRSLGTLGGNLSFVDGLAWYQYLYVFFVGMFAISAMILPGISGSTILLIFGAYIPVVNGVSEVLHFHWSFKLLLGLFVFGMGVICGAVVSVKGIKVCLDKFRPQTVYFVLGMMLGSLYAIVMGPTTLDQPKAMLNVLAIGKENGLRIVPFLIGAVILVGLELFRKFSEKKTEGKKA